MKQNKPKTFHVEFKRIVDTMVKENRKMNKIEETELSNIIKYEDTRKANKAKLSMWVNGEM